MRKKFAIICITAKRTEEWNMVCTVKPITDEYREKALDLVEKAFTDYYHPQEGKVARGVIKEIRGGGYYIPELELIAVDENGALMGYAMFSRFNLEGRYDNELLLLTPVAVKTELQGRHISKEMIEYGLKQAKEMGYTAVLVEGNPDRYHARGFVTSSEHGIVAGELMELPMEECLMVCELVPGALDKMHGEVDFTLYRSLMGMIVD